MKHIKKFIFLGLSFLLILLGACDLIEHQRYHDTALKLQKEDYENMKKSPAQINAHPSFHPKSLSVSKTPLLPLEMNKKVTVFLSDSVALKDVFMELGRQAGVGIGLSPRIGSHPEEISYSAYQIPFIDVIKGICSLAELRYKIEGGHLFIEPDEPYFQTYDIQFLNHTQKSENRISVSTDVFAPIQNQGRADNGSEGVLAGSGIMDFWAELEHNLKILLSSEKAPTVKNNPNYALHKQGGLITVFATYRQHQHIESYLQKLKGAISTQVIIEAKIIEVTLNNEFKSGINWNQLGGDIRIVAPMGGLVMTPPSKENPQSVRDVFTFAVDHENFSTVLNLVKKFGTVRTLSNPRLTVVNNQPAMLKVATNEVFFHLEFERYFQADGKPDIENISSEALTVPIGIVMVVQPSVCLQTGEITMMLRPTVSRVQKEVEDPAVAIKSKSKVKSTVPVVQVRELDSVLKMKSGQVLVMGGLMEDRSSYVSASVPGTEALSFFEELIKGKEDERKVTELVIFLSAHIIEDPWIDGADKRIYNTYTEDPRPLSF